MNQHTKSRKKKIYQEEWLASLSFILHCSCCSFFPSVETCIHSGSREGDTYFQPSLEPAKTCLIPAHYLTLYSNSGWRTFRSGGNVTSAGPKVCSWRSQRGRKRVPGGKQHLCLHLQVSLGHIRASLQIRRPTSRPGSQALQPVFLYKGRRPEENLQLLPNVPERWHMQPCFLTVFYIRLSRPINLTPELYTTLSAFKHSWCLHWLFCEQLLGRCSIWQQESCVFQRYRPWGALAWKVTSLWPHKVSERFNSSDWC